MGYLSEESIICEKYGVLIKVSMKTFMLVIVFYNNKLKA